MSLFINIENKFARYFDDDHGEGTGFEMGSKATNSHILKTELDENYDPLQPEDLFPSCENTSVETKDISKTRKSPSRLSQNQTNRDSEISSDVGDIKKPYEEEDEEEDKFSQKGQSLN